MGFQGRLEVALGAWGLLLCRRPWTAIVPVLLCSAISAAWLPQMRIDSSYESMLHPDDPEAVRYRQFREQFDREDRVVVAVRPPEVFSLDFLEKLRSFHAELEAEVPYLRGITSLVNVRASRSEDGSLVVEALLAEWPESEADLIRIRERILANPLYQNTIVSADLSVATLLLEPDTYASRAADDLGGFADDQVGGGAPEYLGQAEEKELVAALDEVVARFDAPDFPVQVAGPLVLIQRVNGAIERDTFVFALLAMTAIVTLLGILFRRLSGVALPLLVVGLSLLTSLGIMVAAEVPLSVSVQVLPAFLLTVGVCDSVHVLVIFYQRLAAGDRKPAAVAFALRHSGLPVVMTSVTTAAGMLSFLPAALAPVSDLGIMAAVGVLLALAYTLVLLPALLAVLPVERERIPAAGSFGNVLSQRLAEIGTAATQHPWRVLGATSLLTIVSIAGLLQLRFYHDWIQYLPEDDPARIASEELDRDLAGAVSFEVLVDTGVEAGLHDPAVLRSIEAAGEAAEEYRRGDLSVGKALSVVDIVKETHRALADDRPSAYVIPAQREVVAQELLLFEGSAAEDLRAFTDASLRTARLSMRVPNAPATYYPAYLEQVEQRIRAALGDGIEMSVTGMLPLLAQTFTSLIRTMARSYVIAFVLITPLMILLLGQLRRGLIAMIPNVLPIVFVLGLMGWADIPLDASTVLVGAIVLGLAVDDTIHFMHKFERYYAETGSAPDAVRNTLATTGSALLFTSLVLSAGFAVFAFSYTRNTAYFGILASTATLVAFLADVLVSPALLTLETRWRERRPAALAA